MGRFGDQNRHFSDAFRQSFAEDQSLSNFDELRSIFVSETNFRLGTRSEKILVHPIDFGGLSRTAAVDDGFVIDGDGGRVSDDQDIGFEFPTGLRRRGEVVVEKYHAFAGRVPFDLLEGECD